MPTEQQFQGFIEWMLERGRSPSTAELYERNLRHCFDDERGLLARISQDGLAPKTRRTNKAALVAWSEFRGDGKLRQRLSEVRLPPPERLEEKRAVEIEDWRAILAVLENGDLDPFISAAISLVCHRGFRVGDVCRLGARDVRAGLRTGVLQYQAKGNRRIGWTVTESIRGPLEVFAAERGWGRAYDLIAPDCREDRRYEGARLRCQRAFKRVLEDAGIDPEGVSLHLMRRTYAWHFLRFSGGDPVKLQKHMSWRSIQTAMQYVDQTQREELDEIASQMADALG